MSAANLQSRSAFAEAHRWAPEPAQEVTDGPLPRQDASSDAVELALHLLREIAEDPFLRGRQRVAARRYLRRLEQERAEPNVGAT